MRYLICLLLLLSLSACGYSPAVLKNAYDNIGNRYATELKQLIPLSDEQKTGVDAFAAGLHQWHRQYRLPEYAALISRLGDELKQDEPITDQDLSDVVNTLSLYPHFQQAKDSNRQLAVLAKTLSDEQLDQLARQIDKELQEQEEQLLAMSDGSLASAQVSQVNRIAEFLGVVLDKEQLDLIRAHAASFHDQRQAHITATRQWNKELIHLLEQRHQPGFEQRFVAHMESDNSHVQLLRYAPETTRENDRLGVQMLHDLLASLSEEQRVKLADSLQSMGRTLKQLAASGKARG
jgi:hypothetical protein